MVDIADHNRKKKCSLFGAFAVGRRSVILHENMRGTMDIMLICSIVVSIALGLASGACLPLTNLEKLDQGIQ